MFSHITIISAIVSLAAVAIAAPAENSALQARAGVDIQLACGQQWGSGFVAETTGGGCNDWKCINNAGTVEGLNLDVYCTRAYGPNAYATCSGGVYNWKCLGF